MTVLSQRDSVIAVTKSIVKGFDNSEGILNIITTDQRRVVIDTVTEMAAEGSCFLSEEARAKFDTSKKLRSYIASMVTDCFMKDIRMNGGVKYVAKNPGSRCSDGQLKDLEVLKKLLEASGQVEGLANVEAAIAKRKEELAPKVTLNLANLPQDIQDAIASGSIKVA
jgi:hypothetical protein